MFDSKMEMVEDGNGDEEILPMDYSIKTRKVNDGKLKILLERTKESLNSGKSDNNCEFSMNPIENSSVDAELNETRDRNNCSIKVSLTSHQS